MTAKIIASKNREKLLLSERRSGTIYLMNVEDFKENHTNEIVSQRNFNDESKTIISAVKM